MDFVKVQNELLTFLPPHYPAIEVRVELYREDPSKVAIFFVEESFRSLYPMQRYHYLCHLIPQDFWQRELSNAVWFELAPGERPEDLRSPDQEIITHIREDVMKCLRAKGALEALDDLFCPMPSEGERVRCQGDFRNTKAILSTKGFKEDDFFDVFHVLMAQGGFCDCEILYNVAQDSRLCQQHWRDVAEGHEPYDPHEAGSGMKQPAG